MDLRSKARDFVTVAQMQLCNRSPTLLVSVICGLFRHKGIPSEVTSILLVRLDGLGDCILTLPLLAQLRQRFPTARITVVTHPGAEALFKASQDVDCTLVLRSTPLSFPYALRQLCGAIRLFWQSLRGVHFDIAIQPRWDSDTYMATMLCSLTRAPVIVGYEDGTTESKRKFCRGFEKTWTKVLPAGPLQHEVLQNLAVGNALGCGEGQAELRLPLSPAQQLEAREWLGPIGKGPVLAIGLPAGEPKRRWSAERYLALLQLLKQQGEPTVILLTDEDTSDMAQQLKLAFPDARLAHRLPLVMAAAILSKCDLFIGSDSGLGHLAAAVECPTITISPHPLNGDAAHPNSPVRFRPYGPRAIVVQPQTGRSGCSQACQATEPHCILDVTEDEVMSRIRQALPLYFPPQRQEVPTKESKTNVLNS